LLRDLLLDASAGPVGSGGSFPYQRLGAHQQRSSLTFNKMNLIRFDTPENRPRISVSEHRSFIWTNHQHFRTTPITPGNELWLGAPYRHSLARLEGDDCCFFLAVHSGQKNAGVSSCAFVKILRGSQIPQLTSLGNANVTWGWSLREGRSENL
jgi:hypothetical protein